MTTSMTRHILAAALCLFTVTGCGGPAKGEDPRVLSEGSLVRVSLDDLEGRLAATVALSGTPAKPRGTLTVRSTI